MMKSIRPALSPYMTSRLFWTCLACITGTYVVFWCGLIAATAAYTTPKIWWETLVKPEIRHATFLSILSCTVAAAAAFVVAVPAGYLLARKSFPGRSVVDAVLDIPIFLPPTVAGICLIIFFQTSVGRSIESVLPFTYTFAGVVLAQFVVAASFAIRAVRSTFDHLPARPEEVSLTLGATRFQALWYVALPAARRGLLSAFCIAWARSLGEFGPVLVFAGATRFRTEVLPTSVWLELSSGNLQAAVTVSLLMIFVAMTVLIVIRTIGERA